MRPYRRITYEDRCQIYALRKAGKTQAEIGQALGFSQGTVKSGTGWKRRTAGLPLSASAVLSTGPTATDPVQPRKRTSRVRRALTRKMRAERWSPEQLSFWLGDDHGLSVSPEWIYQMIWGNKRMGGDLWRFLRRRGKRYNLRGAQHAGRGVIPHRIDFAERPAIIAAKTRLGDWEGDTIVGAHTNGALLTHVERKSLFMTISKLPRPTANATHRATAHRLNPLRDHVHTITYDNGKEFARHRDTADILKKKKKKCAQREREHQWPHPRLLPQRHGLHYNPPATVARGERLLNRRPRKSLGFQTPNEVFQARVMCECYAWKSTISVVPLSFSVIGRPAPSRLERQPLQLFHNPFRGLPVPQRRNRLFLPPPRHQSRERGWKLAWISPDQFVGSNGDGFWAFGVIAQGSRDTLCLEALLVSVDRR